MELGFCKPALSVVLVGFIHGSQLSGWFLVENLFIIKCFEINLNTALVNLVNMVDLVDQANLIILVNLAIMEILTILVTLVVLMN